MINLLPVSFRRRQMVRKRATQWMAVMCLVFLASWASHWYELREQTALAQQLEVLSREHEPTRTMLKQLVEMRDRLNILQQQESVAGELEYQRNPLVLLGVISRTARQINGRLRVTTLEVTDFQSATPAALAGAGQVPSSSLVLTGMSLDNPAVAELFDELQDSGLFRRVELLTMKERDEGNALRDYEMRCEF